MACLLNGQLLRSQQEDGDPCGADLVAQNYVAMQYFLLKREVLHLLRSSPVNVGCWPSSLIFGREKEDQREGRLHDEHVSRQQKLILLRILFCQCQSPLYLA